MRRPIAACACLLALVTGAWVGLAYPLFAPIEPAHPEDTAAKAAVSTAWRFYDAIDVLLRTADDTALRAVVAPDFVDHVDVTGTPSGRDGLVAYLASLRDTHPTLRLVPDDVVAQGDRAVARLAPTDAAGAILGVPLAGKEPWPRVDVVRVKGGLIVERWGDPAGYSPAITLFAESLTISQHGDLVPTLRRVTVEPSATGTTAPWRGPAVIAVESSALEVTAAKRATSTYAPALASLQPETITAGDSFLVADDFTVAVANRTTTPAIVLVLTLAPPTPMYPSIRETASNAHAGDFNGLISQEFTGSMPFESSPGHLSVALARVILAPGARLASHPVDGLEIVVAEAGTGTATVATALGYSWLRDPQGRSTTAEGSTQLPQGFSLTTKTGATTIYENETAEAATLLFLTITPG